FALFWLYVETGNFAGAEQQIAWASSNPDSAGMPHFAVTVESSFGRLHKGRELARQAKELYRRTGSVESVSNVVADLALIDAQVGNGAEVPQEVQESQRLARTRTNLPKLALALALTGDSRGAKNVIDDLKQRYPVDYQVVSVYGPCVDALQQSARGNVDAALTALEATRRYEFGISFGYFPSYVRGLVLLRAHRGAEAAAEFQKILDRRFLGTILTTHALARFQVARSWALAGDYAKSRAAYQDFLARWKDADVDIPIFKQAKAEYAKLPQ